MEISLYHSACVGVCVLKRNDCLGNVVFAAIQIFHNNLACI